MRRPVEGIATDAAHSMKNGKTEYQGIDLATRQQIFYKDLGNQTTNIGEFLAVVEAVKYIIENDFQPRVIFTDSTTAIAWFKAKKTSSTKPCKDLQRAEMFLRALMLIPSRFITGTTNAGVRLQLTLVESKL